MLLETEISLKDLAELLGLTTRHIQRLAAEGTIPKLAGGKYPLGAAVRAYLASLRSDPPELTHQRARLAKEQADEKEIKNAMLRREVVHVDELSIISDISAAIVTILESIPIRLKRANPGLTQTDLDIVRTEIAKARNECADLTPERVKGAAHNVRLDVDSSTRAPI